jgi:hypothetical protein
VCVCFIFFSGSLLNAQDAESPSSFENIQLGALLDTLSLRFNLDFAWDAGIVNTDSLLHVDIPDRLDTVWISALFNQDGVEVSFTGRQIIIKKPQGKLLKGKVVSISGIVVDDNTEKPLAMVNVGVEGKPVGTTTNDLGQFSFKLPHDFTGLTMAFSYLGFADSRIEIPASDSSGVIRLKSYSVPLPEVQVIYRNPNQIVRAVKAAAKENYPEQPYLMTAFFRETIQQDKQFVEVSEAVIEILKPSYSDRYDSERVRFVRGRTRCRSLLMALSFGHRLILSLRVRWKWYPRKSKPPPASLRLAIRVFSGCSDRPLFSLHCRIKARASSASARVRQTMTLSSAYRTILWPCSAMR